MLAVLAAAALVAYLPGALLYRLPAGRRDVRAALGADERVFWHVMVSGAWSLSVVLALALAGAYRFDRLLLINGGLSAAIVLLARGRLRYRGAAARPGWTVALPIALVALGVWRFFPPAEYTVGGRDPGVYVNEGIQIAQRGAVVVRDEVAAAVPAAAHDLFFPPHHVRQYYSLRFMGFFLDDPGTGAVVGQFPHLYPASMAIGYGLDGLSGARNAVGVWAILGLLAVYFAAARFAGRAVAFAAAALLALHVITVWFSRYPNTEALMQAYLFAACLALARANQDGDAFFGPVAGLLAGLLVFARVDGLLALAAFAAAAVLSWIVVGRRPRAGFVLVAAALAGAGWLYLSGPMRAYFWRPLVYLENLPAWAVWGGPAAAIAGPAILLLLRRRVAGLARRGVPAAVALALITLAGYALLLREPGGRLTDYDAWALRTFTDFYLSPLGLVAALAGLAVAVSRRFWRDPAFVLVFAAFAVFFFFKIQAVPEHFWMARRFLPVILPGALVFAAVAAFGLPGPARPFALARKAGGLVLLAILGRGYAVQAQPVMSHVEYAGVIPYLERLAARFGDRDLVIVESRDASDVHVLALPLAYIYAKPVLVLGSARPDRLKLEVFLEDAGSRYDRVYFVGGGGTDLLSRRIAAAPVAGERIQVPEYEAALNAYPSGVRRKEFDYSIYELRLDEVARGPFALDVGDRDDLYLVRFHAKETSDGRTVRWTGPASTVALPYLGGSEREVVLVLHDGGRPAGAPAAEVRVLFDDTPIGRLTVEPGFRSYVLPLPADLVAAAAARPEPARLRLESTVWTPRALLGTPDDRELGVMLDRVEVR